MKDTRIDTQSSHVWQNILHNYADTSFFVHTSILIHSVSPCSDHWRMSTTQFLCRRAVVNPSLCKSYCGIICYLKAVTIQYPRTCRQYLSYLSFLPAVWSFWLSRDPSSTSSSWRSVLLYRLMFVTVMNKFFYLDWRTYIKKRTSTGIPASWARNLTIHQSYRKSIFRLIATRW